MINVFLLVSELSRRMRNVPGVLQSLTDAELLSIVSGFPALTPSTFAEILLHLIS